MIPELNAAMARARAVAKRVLVHYGEERQRCKAVEEACEAAAAACRLEQCRLAYSATGVETGGAEPARRALLDEIADLVVASCALPGVDVTTGGAIAHLSKALIVVAGLIVHERTVTVSLAWPVFSFGATALAEAINRKAAAMEDRMDRIEGKEVAK